MTQAVDLANAIDTFVRGCKTDGTWDAIKACCIMAAWDGLTGALYPLKGPAPTNVNFTSSDYNRETGLKGNGSNKYLHSNRNNNDDPQDNKHIAVYGGDCTNNSIQLSTVTVNTNGDSYLYRTSANATCKINTQGNNNVSLGSTWSGDSLYGTSRNSSTTVTSRKDGVSGSHSSTSRSPLDSNLRVFGAASLLSNARLSFYSIGEDLDLALLDARVSTLMTDIGAAIP